MSPLPLLSQHDANIYIGLVAIILPLIIGYGRFRSGTTRAESRKISRPNPNEKGNLFIIDGCNGPLKLAKTPLNATSDDVSLPSTLISFLHVKNGESRGDRIDLLPKIDKLLRTMDCLNRAVVFFDGKGMKQINDRTWNVNPWIQVQITKSRDEVDDVIVDLIAERSRQREDESTMMAKHNFSTTFNCHLQTFDSIVDAIADVSNDNTIFGRTECKDMAVYTLTRNEQGGGRKRKHLKPLCLLRPNSPFCVFSPSSIGNITPWFQKSEISTLKQMSNFKIHQLLGRIEKRILKANAKNETVVVTDDILLRQRLVDVGAFVMTFEQLWNLLNGF